MSGNTCKKILVAPEVVDLAETHRMTSIASVLLSLGHEVIILGRGRYDYLFSDKGFKREYIDYDDEWMTDEKFLMMHDLDNYGMNFFTEEELEKFVKEEVELLKRIKPDVVITGFRPSMSISTKIAGVPLVWVLSAVLSDAFFEKGLFHSLPPNAKDEVFILKVLPKIVCHFIFRKIALHTPVNIHIFNKVMQNHRLKKFSGIFMTLRGDFNVMSDAPELFDSMGKLPPYYDFCGPLLMETHIEMPDSLKNYKKKRGRPVVFFSMGSSGDPQIFKEIIANFKDQPFDVFAATTSILNKEDLPFIPDNVIVEKMFPALELTAMSDVAVIHGGQGTVYTTLMAGTPFVGIPMFGEQLWNLENVSYKGCGIVFERAGLKPKKVIEAINKILSDDSYKKNVVKIQKEILKYKADKKFYPPMLAAKSILRFLENTDNSYFKFNSW